MQHKDERSWMLHNVLAAANLPPVSTAYNVDETSNTYALIKEPAIPKLPTLVGAVTVLSLPQCGGLPLDLTSDERKALRLAIIQAVVRELIVWEEPIMVGTAMNFSVVNVHEPGHSDNKIVPIVLRAKRIFRGRPAWDNVKLLVDEEGGARLYFGRCMAFFRDKHGSVFVGIRWYQNVTANGEALDETAMLPRLKLTKINVTIRDVLESVSILPAASIINGALLIPYNDEYWAMQSSMEQGQYIFNNQQRLFHL